MSLLLPLILLLRVTFYHPTGNPMASGSYPFPGAAACSTHFALGTVIRLEGWYEVICLDRGHINSRPWVDVFAATAEEGRFIAKTFSPYAYGQIVETEASPRCENSRGHDTETVEVSHASSV